MLTIAYTVTATKQLRSLPANTREEVIRKVHRYAETGAGQVKALSGRPGMRLRIGDFRVISTRTASTCWSWQWAIGAT